MPYDICDHCGLPLEGGGCDCEERKQAEDRELHGEPRCTCADFDGFASCPVHL